MGKSKKKSAKVLSWCWYCDREFEDDKVLLQHQKAKHFKCPHCPRRLNTAGGLAVHIDQVHKLGTDKITNALPGRDTFDVEIYGMEGIPAPDLAAWKRRVAERTGQNLNENKVVRPKVRKLPLTPQEAVIQLAQHKALMSGNSANNSLAQLPFGLPPGVPPPPPGYIPPLPPGVVLPPHIQARISGLAPMSGLTPPVAPIAASPVRPAASGLTPVPPIPAAASTSASTAASPTKEKLPSSAVEMKPGTTLVYGDADVSPEEKRARLSQYKVVLAESPAAEAKPEASAVEEAAPDATPMEAEAEPPVAQAEPEEEKTTTSTTARSTRSKRKLDAPAPTAASTRSKRTRAAELI